ncbi:MAG: hypothetical protein ACRDUY_01280 [Nitriliruptorales bacterium]
MARDVRELLREAVPEVRTRPDLGSIERRVRVRRGARFASVGMAAIVVLAGAVGFAQQLMPDAEPPFVIENPDEDTGPSPAPTSTPPAGGEDEGSRPGDGAVAPAVDLPRPLVASMPGLVELDPQTGEVLRTLDGPTGEGWGAVSLTPDATTVFHEEMWTGCATRLWRTPLYGGEPELIGPGLRPAVSPDGSRLAYVGYEPCVPDDHRLVLRDLETGAEQTWPLDQRDDELARIESLSWAPGSRTIAVEVSYTPREENVIGAPTSSVIHLVNTSGEPRPVQESPIIMVGDHTIQWTLPTFRGERGTLLVVELCCDIGLGGGYRHDDAETYTILEVDPTREGDDKVLGTVLETSDRISHLDTDASGDHILWVEEESKEEGRAARAVLKRLTGGEAVDLAEDAYAADWGPMTPQVPQSLYAHPAPELEPRSVAAGREISVSGDDSHREVCDAVEATLLDGGREVSEVTLEVDWDGSYAGLLDVPEDLEPGTYQIRASCLKGGNLAGSPTNQPLTVTR